MRIFKRLVIIFISILVLLFIVGIIAINPNYHKNRIESLFNKATGLNLCLGGEIHYNIFPKITRKYWFSTLKIMENLGKDPVAEIVLYNMMQFKP